MLAFTLSPVGGEGRRALRRGEGFRFLLFPLTPSPSPAEGEGGKKIRIASITTSGYAKTSHRQPSSNETSWKIAKADQCERATVAGSLERGRGRRRTGGHGPDAGTPTSHPAHRIKVGNQSHESRAKYRKPKVPRTQTATDPTLMVAVRAATDRG